MVFDFYCPELESFGGVEVTLRNFCSDIPRDQSRVGNTFENLICGTLHQQLWESKLLLSAINEMCPSLPLSRLWPLPARVTRSIELVAKTLVGHNSVIVKPFIDHGRVYEQ